MYGASLGTALRWALWIVVIVSRRIGGEVARKFVEGG